MIVKECELCHNDVIIDHGVARHKHPGTMFYYDFLHKNNKRLRKGEITLDELSQKIIAMVFNKCPSGRFLRKSPTGFEPMSLRDTKNLIRKYYQRYKNDKTSIEVNNKKASLTTKKHGLKHSSTKSSNKKRKVRSAKSCFVFK